MTAQLLLSRLIATVIRQTFKPVVCNGIIKIALETEKKHREKLILARAYMSCAKAE